MWRNLHLKNINKKSEILEITETVANTVCLITTHKWNVKIPNGSTNEIKFPFLFLVIIFALNILADMNALNQ